MKRALQIAAVLILAGLAYYAPAFHEKTHEAAYQRCRAEADYQAQRGTVSPADAVLDQRRLAEACK